MVNLDSFQAPIQIAIIGASGGIGKAFIHYLEHHPSVGKIHAFSRKEELFHSKKITSYKIDISNEETIKEASLKIDTLDLIIITTGLLHKGSEVMPEKSLTQINQKSFEKLLLTNTIGPALVAKYFIPLLNKTSKSVFAALSARIGSISDNHLGGWYSYRCSKAALNMFIKTLSIEAARKLPHAAIIALHPGTVNTNLSKPFQSNVPTEKLFTSSYAAEKLLQVINNINKADTGKCFAWDGKEIDP